VKKKVSLYGLLLLLASFSIIGTIGCNPKRSSPDIILSTSNLTTTENSSTGTFTVVLKAQPTSDVTINISISDTTEGLISGGNSPSTLTASITLTFTSSNWSIPQTVTVTGQDDSIVDGNQTFTIVTAAANSTDSGYSGLNPDDVSVTNSDNDTAGISVNPANGLVTTEAGDTDTFTVALNTKPASDVTIDISSSDTTEDLISGGDFPTTPVASITLTFTSSDWSTPQAVTVTGQDDSIVDGNQTFTIITAAANSADSDYSDLDPADVSVTNNDDDTAGISVNPANGLVTTEAGGTDTFTVVLNTKPASDVTIDISSSDTTEDLISGGDSPITPVASITLTFTSSDWSTPQTVTATGQNDSIADGNQTFTIITATANSADSDYSGLDPVDVSVINNDDEPDISVNPVSGLFTIEAGGTDTFTVVLNTQPTSDVTVDVSSSDTIEGLVSGGDSPITPVASITLTFTSSDWSTPQTVIVTGQNDSIADGNQTFTIITAAANSSDWDYSGLDPADVSVTNNDDDTAGITVNPVSGLVITEAGGTDTFSVVLNTQPTSDVTVDVSSSDTIEGLVSGGNSPTTPVASITLTFTPSDWSTPQTVIVTGQDDSTADGNQTFSIITVVAVSTDSNYSALDPADVSVTNNDDDTAGISVNPANGLVTTETGGTDTFSVVLNTQPTSDVTIDVSSGDTTEGLVSGGDSPTTPVASITLTFTSSDWSTPQTVTVTGQNDSTADGNQAFSIITAAAVSADLNYSALDPDDVSVSNSEIGEGTISGSVKDAITDSPLQNVVVETYDGAGSLLGSETTNSTGDYSLLIKSGVGYRVEFYLAGYMKATLYNVTVDVDITTYLETVLQIDEAYSGLGNVSGMIVNALDGIGVNGLIVNLRAGINVTSGQIVTTTTTVSDGSYSFTNLSAGHYTAEVNGSGYNTTYFTIICIGGTTTTANQDATITLILSSGETRIVLEWGATPYDLDSHLTGPTSGGDRFHIYYGNQTYTYNTTTYADLDLDDIYSYGPETTTIYQHTSK